MTTPLPCPFCGGKASYFHDDGRYPSNLYECETCEASSEDCDSQGQALDKWNRRTLPWRKWPEEKPDDEGEEAVWVRIEDEYGLRLVAGCLPCLANPYWLPLSAIPGPGGD